jgi:hypothetical protein
MTAPRCSCRRPLLLAIAATLLIASRSAAHVDLASPNGGEALLGNATHQIRWMPAVATHDTLNFDLWYSAIAAGGPWTTIVADLPAGDLSVGSIHTFNWTVPNITDSSVWVRVRQENGVDADYEAVSAASFSIAAAGPTGDYNDDGDVDAVDYTVWRNALGQTGAGLAADGNNNGQIDAGDYTVWKQHYGESGGNGGIAGAQPIPEPTTGVVLLGVLVVMSSRLRRGRVAGDPRRDGDDAGHREQRD